MTAGAVQEAGSRSRLVSFPILNAWPCLASHPIRRNNLPSVSGDLGKLIDAVR